MSGLEEEIASLKRTVSEQSARIATLEKEKEEMKKENAGKDSTIAQLEKENATKDSTIATLGTKIAELEKRLATSTTLTTLRGAEIKTTLFHPEWFTRTEDKVECTTDPGRGNFASVAIGHVISSVCSFLFLSFLFLYSFC
jgi:predicted RNase H-like nuclease (RuvC/YqgF family)